MSRSTIIGLTLGFIAVFVGMAVKGASLAILWNPAAIMIIILGTIACVFIAFPMTELKKLPKLLKIIFMKPKLTSKQAIIFDMVKIASDARKEGLLSLENKLDELSDDFLKYGVQLLVDGNEVQTTRNIMTEEIYAIEGRHHTGAQIFTQAGTYAPTLGVLGAVVGLIGALGNLADIDKLGQSIAAAFVATLLGIFTGYVLWHPIANKLKAISRTEVELKTMIVEGITHLGSGVSPVLIEQYLMSYLSKEERQLYARMKGVTDDVETAS
ncbi:MAG: flagellar motor stator protein MotA [Bacillota bacterium]|jgi:chemotaxis protein MotA